MRDEHAEQQAEHGDSPRGPADRGQWTRYHRAAPGVRDVRVAQNPVGDRSHRPG
ncbi:hypothetical protein ACVW19_003202 [Streptomyces sp. TE5632]